MLSFQKGEGMGEKGVPDGAVKLSIGYYYNNYMGDESIVQCQFQTVTRFVIGKVTATPNHPITLFQYL